MTLAGGRDKRRHRLLIQQVQLVLEDQRVPASLCLPVPPGLDDLLGLRRLHALDLVGRGAIAVTAVVVRVAGHRIVPRRLASAEHAPVHGYHLLGDCLLVCLDERRG